MKTKHNKKRNTAFVYEALVREGTSAILQNDEQRKRAVVEIIKEHFKEGSVLKQDLECYRSLYENQNITLALGQKIIKEATLQKRLLDPNILFDNQTKLIHDINKKLTPSLFDNFVPNYKTLATISQLFSLGVTPKNRVVLEQLIVENMSNSNELSDNNADVDSLVVESFVKKFNEKYANQLVKEQKELLTHYIASFTDNALQLKMFLNEEVARLKNELKKALSNENISDDTEMLEKTQNIIKELEGYKNQEINETMLLVVLKTQSLLQELSSNADSN